MFDKKRKIIIGWSAKCGCSHIKKIIKYLNNFNHVDLKNNIHLGTYNKLPKNFLSFNHIIIIIRNPYERLISGFNDKYKLNGSFRYLWKKDELNFKNFVDELILNRYTNIEKHHFTPQTSEEWNDDILKHKNIKFFDLKNIDYSFIESIYNKKIPDYILNDIGEHINKKTKEDLGEVCNIPIDYLHQLEYTPITCNYYNDEIKQKVYDFYKKDFDIFNNFGFNYEIPNE